jgi:hypothetical protein
VNKIRISKTSNELFDAFADQTVIAFLIDSYTLNRIYIRIGVLNEDIVLKSLQFYLKIPIKYFRRSITDTLHINRQELAIYDIYNTDKINFQFDKEALFFAQCCGYLEVI